jgi:ParB-like chromosome segregation protein Spo0J
MAVDMKPSSVSIEYVDINDLHPHPRNVEIYGVNEDVSELAKKIQEKGKLDYNIVINQHNRIISGHRRWQATKSLKWTTVPVERRIYTSELDELEALLIANVYRDKTHLQRASEFEMWLEVYKEKNEEKQKAQGDKGGNHDGIKGAIASLTENRGNNLQNTQTLQSNLTEGSGSNKSKASPKPKKQPAPQSRDQAAKDVGLSATSANKSVKALHAVKQLREEGKNEEADVLASIANKSLDAAFKIVDITKEENIAALSKIATGEAKDVKEAKQVVRREKLAEKAKTVVLPQEIQLLHGNFLEVGSDIADNSVPLIFTDPPYHEKHLELWSNLGSFAARVLKPGGMLLAYSGQIALPQVLNALSEHLDYCWLLGQFHKGQHIQIWKYQIWNEWKPLVLFSKGKPILNDWFIDAYDGIKGDKEAHEWAQGEDEAQYFIQKLTQPGDLVVDPMCGSGPIVRMAHRFKRHSIGIEIDKQRYDVALGSMEALMEV